MDVQDLMDIGEFIAEFPGQLGVARIPEENEPLRNVAIRKHFVRIRKLLEAYEDVTDPKKQIPLCAGHGENWFCDRDSLSSETCVVCAHYDTDERPQPSRDALEITAHLAPIVSIHTVADLLLVGPGNVSKLINSGRLRAFKTSEAKSAPKVIVKRDVALLVTQMLKDAASG